MSETAQTSAGVIALAGAPNVGKSTLLNRIIGQRLSIASAKPQTTRSRVLAIDNRGPVQLVFTDTPGIHRPRALVHDRMVERARQSVAGADIVCWIVAADTGLGPIDRRELPRLAERPLLVLINKIDRVKRPDLLPLLARIDSILPATECIPLSAKTGENVDLLIERLTASAPQGPWLYPEGTLTDQPLRFFVAELVREQLFIQLDEELPYRVAVKVELYEERDGSDYIEATIYTDSISTRRIILGHGGARIKSIGTAARRAIEKLADHHVYLKLTVKVKKDWHKNRRFLEELGL